MKHHKHQDLVQRLKQNMNPHRETFKVDGEQFPYLLYINTAQNKEASMAEYRNIIYRMLNDAKEEDELRNLPFKEKLRRYSKNAGLEILAASLTGIFAPLRIGGVSVSFDGLLDKKESTYLSYKHDKRFYEEHGYYPVDNHFPFG